MSANKIAETSTSTGTGNFTLDGAWSQSGTYNTGNRTFDSFYGLNHYFPYMIQDQSGNWEKGIGYLSATTTLVRDAVTDNSAGTTTQINFASGSKLVMVPSDAGAAWPQSIVSGNVIRGANLRAITSGTLAVTADRLYLTPFLAKRPMKVSAISFEVSTLAASTDVRCGIYSTGAINTSSPKLSLITGSEGTVSSASTGSKDVTVDCEIGQGYYFIGMSSTGTPTLRTTTAALEDIGQFSTVNATYNTAWYRDSAGSSAALPASITAALTGMGSGISMVCGLKGVIQ